MATDPYRDLTVLLYAAARLRIWLAIFAAIFVPIERVFALHSQKIFRKEIAVDLGYYFLDGLLPGLVLGPRISLAVLAIHYFIPGGVLGAIAAWPIWLKACATMMVGETAYYWVHRLSHQIPFLWRFHARASQRGAARFPGQHALASHRPGMVADDHADADLRSRAREPGPL
jgi:sterol desaturase/sphingolipid hydroxylase (fatty acid hydroxylase superfamily)